MEQFDRLEIGLTKHIQIRPGKVVIKESEKEEHGLQRVTYDGMIMR